MIGLKHSTLLISKFGSRVLHISSKRKITATANNLNMNPGYIAEGIHLGRGKLHSTVCLLISAYLMPQNVENTILRGTLNQSWLQLCDNPQNSVILFPFLGNTELSGGLININTVQNMTNKWLLDSQGKVFNNHLHFQIFFIFFR